MKSKFRIVLLLPVCILLSFKLLHKQNSSDESEQPKNTRLSFPSFQLIIYDYKVYNTILNEEENSFEYSSPYSGMVDTSEIGFHKNKEGAIIFFAKKDTLRLEGVTDEFIGNRLLQILPKNKNDRFKINLWIEESISEQYDPRKFQYSGQSMQEYQELINNWEKNKVRWSATRKYKQIKDSLNYFYRIPTIGEDAYEEIRKKMNLRDTLVDLSGESTNIATAVYKNKPCYYGIGKFFIQIERFTKGKHVETKYIYFNDTGGD